MIFVSVCCVDHGQDDFTLSRIGGDGATGHTHTTAVKLELKKKEEEDREGERVPIALVMGCMVCEYQNGVLVDLPSQRIPTPAFASDQYLLSRLLLLCLHELSHMCVG